MDNECKPLIHPTATVLGEMFGMVNVGERCVIAKDVIIKHRTYVGDYVIIKDGVRIDSGCYIGAGVSIGLGVTIGTGVYIAPGTIVRNYAILTNYCSVGRVVDKYRKKPSVGICVIGEYTRLGLGTIVSNNCRVGSKVVTGIQVVILDSSNVGNGVRIGDNLLVPGWVRIPEQTVVTYSYKYPNIFVRLLAYKYHKLLSWIKLRFL